MPTKNLHLTAPYIGESGMWGKGRGRGGEGGRKGNWGKGRPTGDVGAGEAKGGGGGYGGCGG